jgi:hypothetical protein
MMGVDFKESKSMTEGCAMEHAQKEENGYKPLGFWGTFCPLL